MVVLVLVLVLLLLLVVVVVEVEIDADDDGDADADADDAADPTLHLLACWPAVGRQPLKSGQQALSMGNAPGRRP